MKLGDLEISTDEIVVASLKQSLEWFEVDLKTIEETSECIGFVSWDDIEVEKEAIIKHIESLKTVIFYYTGDEYFKTI